MTVTDRWAAIAAAATLIAGALPAAAGAQTGGELATALRGGGHVLVLRHTHTDRSRQDRQVDYADRSTQRNLSDRGIHEARRIGSALRTLGIPATQVYTSPFFRTLDTANEAFGEAIVEPALSSRERSSDRRTELFSAPVDAGAVRILVSHQGVIRSMVPGLRGLTLEEGDAVVLRPDGNGGHRMLGIIRVDDWEPLPGNGGDGHAPAPTLHVSDNVLVLSPPDWAAVAEPHLAAHPTLPGHLVAGVIVSDTAGAPSERSYCALLVSVDTGLTWREGNVGITNCADPWLAVTGSGEAVFLSLGRHAANGHDTRMGLLAARSADGGLTWSHPPVSLGFEHDRPTMAVDRRADAARSVVVFSGRAVKLDDYPVRYSVYVSRSVNAGQSFRQPAHIVPSNLNLNSEEGVVLGDGTVLASFIDFMRNVDGFRSREGMLERRRIWMLRSDDGGRTFSPPLFVSESCGQSAYDVAADLSGGPHDGRVYLTCRVHGGTGIALHYSDDRAETWSAPFLIPGSETHGTYQPQPRLAVNGAGTVAVAWLHSPDDPAAACYRVMAAASVDGGSSFSAPTPVSPGACPQAARNGFVFRRWRMGGDYFGWAAAADGRFHAMWADARRGPFELWTAHVTVSQ